MPRLLLPALALLLAAPPLPAQTAAVVAEVEALLQRRREQPRLAQIPAAMQAFVDDKQIAGAVTLVGCKSGVLAFDAVGLADIESKRPMTKETLFRIASMTKPVTALAVMMLQDEGKLSVGDPVAKHLPEFAGQKLAVKADGKTELKEPSRPITLKDLLTHTSGLPSGYPAPMNDLYAKRNFSLAESTALIAKQPLQFEPGAKWSYCNSGIDTLGRVVEVVGGKKYEDFLKERLFAPLGMTDTTFYPTEAQLARLATTYKRTDKGQLEVGGGFPIALGEKKHPVPAGGLFSTAGDLAKLYRMLLNGGELDGKRYVSAAALKEMTTVHTGDLKAAFTPETGFGLGVAVVRKPGPGTAGCKPGTFGHGGAFGTQGWIDPASDTFIVLLIQRSNNPNGDGHPVRAKLQELAGR